MSFGVFLPSPCRQAKKGLVMLNFRTLKKDFSSSMLKSGKDLFSKESVSSAKIVSLSPSSVRLGCRVVGNFENSFECELEIDRKGSCITDSNCDCTYKYDCQHLAAILFYLEKSLDELIVSFSKEADLEKGEQAKLKETFEEAKTKEVERKGKQKEKEILQEYVTAADLFGKSPFFLPSASKLTDQGEIAVVFTPSSEKDLVDLQLFLRLPYRSKPLIISDPKEFLSAVRYTEPLFLANKRFSFSLDSFDAASSKILHYAMHFARFLEDKNEKTGRIIQMDREVFGNLLAEIYSGCIPNKRDYKSDKMPALYCASFDEPLRFSQTPAKITLNLEYWESGNPKLFLLPSLDVEEEKITALEEANIFASSPPGMIHNGTYYPFDPNIRRQHLCHLKQIRDMTIPEPLFGTFVENALPELKRFARISNEQLIERFVTLPFTKEIRAVCRIHYLDGELEASVEFVYDTFSVPYAPSQLSAEHFSSFVTKEGIYARNLTEEQTIIDEVFQDFAYNPAQGIFVTKSDKKIVEFMTEVIPQNQHRVTFHCPQNLSEQFLYDATTFSLKLKETDRIDVYQAELGVNGCLNGVTVDQLWECLATKRRYIELAGKKRGMGKILVLDLEKIAPVVQIFDEIGMQTLTNHVEERPLWTLASVEANDFKDLPITFSMSAKLKEIQQQMKGSKAVKTEKIPSEINASFRKYQQEGVFWLDRLRQMHLNGVLADDMGLGKTLQAITALTQFTKENPKIVSLVVCPTSLVYNWEEEIHKFNPKLKVLPVDGTPSQRKKLIDGMQGYNVLVTTYSLLQKDIDLYKDYIFGYCILDEAQHIKNRSTRNAKSVKQIKSLNRLILTGTPIENSLDELWSLFDFLMPGLLSTYERFVEKYIRSPVKENGKNLDLLRRKLSPFILRRMKKDVLSELPPVSEIIYHCHLTETQKKLYKSYAASAREELAQLVKKDGFEKVQIHVLATLTRLKQICCHPAIFAKEHIEQGDSAKYEMLLELLENLVDGNHKTVIFSQYTRMLNIMRNELTTKGISFEYLDGTSKNRLSIVKRFNEDPNISVFLVSLKAGGSGLNLTSADTVIHYDMWWNPAVENQATDRVHRIGQKNSVSSYKLVTLGTIEEKIVELQNRKKGLVKKVISSDEEVMSKLTWEEVLELLQT